MKKRKKGEADMTSAKSVVDNELSDNTLEHVPGGSLRGILIGFGLAYAKCNYCSCVGYSKICWATKKTIKCPDCGRANPITHWA